MGFSESDVIDALRVSGNKEGDAVSIPVLPNRHAVLVVSIHFKHVYRLACRRLKLLYHSIISYHYSANGCCLAIG